MLQALPWTLSAPSDSLSSLGPQRVPFPCTRTAYPGLCLLTPISSWTLAAYPGLSVDPKFSPLGFPTLLPGSPGFPLPLLLLQAPFWAPRPGSTFSGPSLDPQTLLLSLPAPQLFYLAFLGSSVDPQAFPQLSIQPPFSLPQLPSVRPLFCLDSIAPLRLLPCPSAAPPRPLFIPSLAVFLYSLSQPI